MVRFGSFLFQVQPRTRRRTVNLRFMGPSQYWMFSGRIPTSAFFAADSVSSPFMPLSPGRCSLRPSGFHWFITSQGPCCANWAGCARRRPSRWPTSSRRCIPCPKMGGWWCGGVLLFVGGGCGWARFGRERILRPRLCVIGRPMTAAIRCGGLWWDRYIGDGLSGGLRGFGGWGFRGLAGDPFSPPANPRRWGGGRALAIDRGGGTQLRPLKERRGGVEDLG